MRGGRLARADLHGLVGVVESSRLGSLSLQNNAPMRV